MASPKPKPMEKSISGILSDEVPNYLFNMCIIYLMYEILLEVLYFLVHRVI